MSRLGLIFKNPLPDITGGKKGYHLISYHGDDPKHGHPSFEAGCWQPVEVGPTVRRELLQDAGQLTTVKGDRDGKVKAQTHDNYHRQRGQRWKSQGTNP